jgi:adenylate cyclase
MDFSRPLGGDGGETDGSSGGDSSAPGRAEIEAALERVLASRILSASPRQQALLRHIATETLEGRGDRLKEFSLAVDVFGRPGSFDPRVDSIVRVQASRLRTQLAEFYAKEGAAETLRIEIPAGGYIATFVRASAAAAPKQGGARSAPDLPAPDVTTGEPPLPETGGGKVGKPPNPLASIAAGRPWLLPAILAAASLALLVLILATLGGRPLTADSNVRGQRPSGPVIFVTQYQLIDGPEFAAILRNGLQYELIDSLSRFPELSVLGIDTVYGSSPDTARENPYGADFILTGSVQAAPSEVQVTSQLVRASDNTVVWSRVDTAPIKDASGMLDVQSSIAGAVAGQLGQPYGVIQERLKEDLSESRAVSLDDYLCVLRAYDYSRVKTREKHAEVRACLEQVVQHSPSYSPAWAKLSWMYGDEVRFGYNPLIADPPPFARARAAAEKAVAANGSSAMAHQYLALALLGLDDDRGARLEIEEALRLNPNNSEILADAAQILSQLGDLERAREMAEKAISINPGHPAWYHGPLAIYHILKGNRPEALRAAQEAAMDGSPLAGYLLAAALRLNGDGAKADQALESLYATHPEARDNREELVKRLRLPEKLVELIFGT